MEAELIALPNGVRLVLDPMASLHTAALGVYVRVGARWEDPAQNGIAHLFEHMAFKGAGGRSAQAFAEAIEAVGGAINAATGYERTAYYARVTAAHAPFALGLLADVMFAPHWSAEELEKEKGVVRQEMGEAFDVPEDRLFELMQAGVFAGQPMGRPILGAVETLEGVQVADLEAFRDAHVTGDRVVVSVAGAYPREALIELCAARFGHLPKGGGACPQPAEARPARLGETRRIEQMHIAASWAGAPAGHDDGFPLRLLGEILGGGMASRLFQEVRERRGLAYAVDAYVEAYEDVGRLGVYAGCSADKAGEVMAVAAGALEDLAATGPTEAELARAKAVLAAQILMGAEAPSARAEARAGQVFLRGRPYAFEDIAARYEAVSAEHVAALAGAALAGAHCVAAIGPKTGLAALGVTPRRRPRLAG